MHPDWVAASSFANNFAIIKLASPVTFSNRIAPICLPSADTDYNDRISTVAGWGTAEVGGDFVNSDILQEARIDLT